MSLDYDSMDMWFVCRKYPCIPKLTSSYYTAHNENHMTWIVCSLYNCKMVSSTAVPERSSDRMFNLWQMNSHLLWCAYFFGVLITNGVTEQKWEGKKQQEKYSVKMYSSQLRFAYTVVLKSCKRLRLRLWNDLICVCVVCFLWCVNDSNGCNLVEIQRVHLLSL